uniref:Uncharacterized protein n=1 Tax=Lotus japonicus TaxID=34305 RepID=I3SSQ9_LOTJA|nr:unknown [Lotus japonicus]
MDLVKASSLKPWRIPSPPLINITTSTATTFYFSPRSSKNFSFPFSTFQVQHTQLKPLILHGKKRNSSDSEPVLEPTIVQEVSMDEEEDDEFDYEEPLNDEDEDGDGYYDDDEQEEEEFEDEDEDSVPYAGDGGSGGGISLAGSWWDKKALAIAKEVTESFDGDLQIYAFRTLLRNSAIQVRIEKLSNKSGSPNIEDIEAFSTTYRAKLDEAELTKSVPENLTLEVSSPGVERVVRIPDDLDRFKDRSMYVRYAIDDDDSMNPSAEGDGVFKLESFDLDTKYCTWSLADVRVNREKAGKGRPLNKKQREWRLSTPFDSLRFVRLHSGT